MPSYWERPILHEPTLTDLVGKRYLSSDTASFLAEVVKRNGRVVVYGNADTGKTALADALAAHVPLGAVLERRSRTERSLARQGLSPLQAPSRPVSFLRVDDDVDRVREWLGSGAGLVASLRSGSLRSLQTLLGAEERLPLDVVVETRKHRDDTTGRTVRYVASVLISDRELTEIESGFVDPWGEVRWRRIETAQARSRHLLERSTPEQRSGDMIHVGTDLGGLPITLTTEELAGHALLLGSTGSGLGATCPLLVEGMLQSGWSGVVFDTRGDGLAGGLRDQLARLAGKAGVPFQTIAVGEENELRLDLFAGLDPEAARDLALSAVRFDSAYHRALGRKVAGQLSLLLVSAHQLSPTEFPLPTIARMGAVLSSPNLHVALKKVVAGVLEGTELTREEFSALLTPSRDESAVAAHIGAVLTSLAAPTGRTLLAEGGAEPLFDVTAVGLSHVGLDPAAQPQLSHLASSALLRQLTAEAKGDWDGPQQRFVWLTDVETFDVQALVALSAVAQRAGIALLATSRSPLEWDGKDPALFSLLADANVVLAMNQSSNGAAERTSSLLGSPERAWELRNASVGDMVLRVNSPHVKVVSGRL